MLPHRMDMATFISVMLEALPNAFTRALALQRGLSERGLRGLVRDGQLMRLGPGLYRKSNAPPADLDRIELVLQAPQATLCLATALAHHDLCDLIPAALDVALPRGQRPPRVHAPIRWHRFHEATFQIGRTEVDVDDGLMLGVYSAERSIIDAFRMRHHEGDELGIEAVRRWLGRPGASPAGLLAIATHFPKAEPALLRVLRILA
jgi:hypothetical protein